MFYFNASDMSFFLKPLWACVCFVGLILCCGCLASTEEKLELLENRLDSFVGKRVRDVINVFGNPTKYSNRSDLPGMLNGTYMVYDYSVYGYDCVISFKYEKTSLTIKEWDYEGNCLLFGKNVRGFR